MPVKSYKVGPGTFTIGPAGSEISFSCQVTKAVLEWSVETTDDIDVLCGDTEPGDDTFTASMNGTMLQDLDELAHFTWMNKGAILPFKYTPQIAIDQEITGILRLRPMNIGGDVKSKPTWDFEFPCVGEPSLGPAITEESGGF
jgi:hypothetical protein